MLRDFPEELRRFPISGQGQIRYRALDVQGLPRQGDVIIRQWGSGEFEVLDALTHQRLASFQTFDEALASCLANKGRIWQQTTDNRGRPMGDPVILPPRVRD